jgi:hypothetical protein
MVSFPNNLSFSLSISLSIFLSLLSALEKRLFDVFYMSVQHARYADTVWSCFACRVDAEGAEARMIMMGCKFGNKSVYSV